MRRFVATFSLLLAACSCAYSTFAADDSSKKVMSKKVGIITRGKTLWKFPTGWDLGAHVAMIRPDITEKIKTRPVNWLFLKPSLIKLPEISDANRSYYVVALPFNMDDQKTHDYIGIDFLFTTKDPDFHIEQMYPASASLRVDKTSKFTWEIGIGGEFMGGKVDAKLSEEIQKAYPYLLYTLTGTNFDNQRKVSWDFERQKEQKIRTGTLTTFAVISCSSKWDGNLDVQPFMYFNKHDKNEKPYTSMKPGSMTKAEAMEMTKYLAISNSLSQFDKDNLKEKPEKVASK